MRKILLIEDDESLASSCRNSLEARNYAVETATDGSSGYYAIYNKPDLVLLDLSLPQMDGLTILGKIRAQKQFQKLPVYVLADSMRSANVAEAMAAGATGCLNKSDPAILQQILTTTTACLDPYATAEPAAPVSMASPAIPLPAAPSSPAPAATSETLAAAAPTPKPKSKPVAKPAPAPEETEPSEIAHTEDLRQLFAEQYGPMAHALRKAFMGFSVGKTAEDRQPALAEFRRIVANLRRDALQCECDGLPRLLQPMENMAKQAEESGNAPSPLAMQLLAGAVDLLATFHGSAPNLRILNSPDFSALVVDDEPVSRKAISLALQKSRFSVTAVGESTAGLKEAEDTPFDLILLDVEMPGMNGFGLCARIRTLAQHKTTPILFISSLDDFKSRASSRVSGGNQFITKPIQFNEVTLAALTHIFRQRLASGSAA